MRLAFGSREEAVAYAKRQGLEYELHEPVPLHSLEEPASGEPKAAPAMPIRATTPLIGDLAA